VARPAPPQVRRVDAAELAQLLPRLSELLVDSVRHGASVGFLDPLAPAEADAYWGRVATAVANGGCVLLVAETAADGVLGTVQLDLDTPANQRHRGSVSKLLVHSGARRQGVGAALMVAVEAEAAAAGRWLLVLDTATADADRLYLRAGWTLAGAIPDYARDPDGALSHTNLYFKRLSAG
jgi:GNAT superfamily N-acetyltransferase